MKKDTILTTRVTPEMKSLIKDLAEKDDRPLAWMVRKLLTEALEARGLLKKSKKRAK